MKTATATQDLGIVPGTIVGFDKVLNLIINGLDNNAIGYWAQIDDDKVVLPKGFTPRSVEWLDAEQREFHTTCWKGYFAPLVAGGSMTLVEYDENDGSAIATYVLDLDAVRRGLDTMAKIAPKHFGDMMAEDDDIWTADAFFQCACMGELKYG